MPLAVTPPAAVYAERLAARRAALARHARADARVGTLRLLVFLAGVAVAAWAFFTGAASPFWGLAALPVFTALVVVHERVVRARARAARAVAHVERGVARLEDRWRGKGTSGARFLDESHPYAADLDLFGAGSVYELLCTARTRAGQARLAQYLLERARADEVRARQGAVRELAPALDLREEVDALADHVADYAAGKGGDEAHLLAWAARDASMPAWLLPAAALFVATSLTTLALAALDVVPSLVPAIVLAAQAGFAALVRKRANATLEGAEHADDELKVLAGLLARIETMDVQAPLLASLHARLLTEGERPSRVVARLTAHLDRLRQQQNQFFIPIASVLLWRTVHAALIGRWRRTAGPRLPEWIAVVAEVEALLSLATYAYEHPEDIEPVILDAPREGPPTIAGRALGHPLLPGGGVRNDVALGATRLYVVSGSNMSGKSTFLRTIGVNAVLALAGGRVRAQELSLSPLAIGCTLRVQDSLEKGASRFYAEILRLKAIMKLAGEGPLLFLIDELLAGTNSRDRQVGGAAILQGLVARGAIGLASTHDLALASVAEALGDRARNVHFADVLEGDRVVFDYRLKDGVVDRSNALALMRAVGLDV